MKTFKFAWLLILLPLLLTSCLEVSKPTIGRGFYYWKSDFQLSQQDCKTLEKLRINRIYLKFFDVVWEGSPVPAATVSFSTPPPDSLELVPTIFITNETIANLSLEQIPDLASKISGKLDRMIKNNKLKAVPEVQLDCDWTVDTRAKYFQLLRSLRSRLTGPQTKLSATIRLHQIKYYRQTGVPPCDRGMLMFYNMARLNDPRTKNSILDPELGRAYLTDLEKYPLPLDLALPIFSWAVVFQDDRFIGLVNGVSRRELRFNPNCQPYQDNYYRLQANLYLHQTQLYKGDLLRVEESRYQDCLRSADYLRPKLAAKSALTVALFHFDPETIRRFGDARLENVFNRFR